MAQDFDRDVDDDDYAGVGDVSTTSRSTTNTGFRYFLASNRYLFSLDGSIVDLVEKNTNKFKYMFPQLLSEKIHNIIDWYNAVVVYCGMYGIFVLPFACVFRSTNSVYGFTSGDSHTDAFPAAHSFKLEHADQVIFSALQYRGFGTLTASSPIKNLLASFHLQGYAILHQVIQLVHPAYEEFRTLEYTQDRPRQTYFDATQRKTVHLTTQAYFSRYLLYLTMDALFNDAAVTLSDKNEQNIFFLRCDRGAEMLPLLDRDRDFPHKHHQFVVSNLVRTVTTAFGLLPPLRSRSPYDKSSSSSAKKSYLPYTKKSVNQVTTDASSNDSDDSDDSDDASFDAAFLDVPIDATIFAAVTSDVRRNPAIINHPTCLICKHVRPDDAQHRFFECPLCQNHPLCRSMFISTIKHCTQVLKDLEYHSKKISADDQTKTINSITEWIQAQATQDFPPGNSVD